ncbi:MAG TPA: phosphatidate cytidylyltransferase [Actinotalea sp.]|nr:phosphatidate cytidylyltransferase [Actinotalea sp.]
MAESAGTEIAPGGSSASPRGGRDLPIAIGVGVGLLVVVVGSLAFRKELFILVAVAFCVAGMWELAQAFARRGIRLPLLPLLVGAVGILVSSYAAGPEALVVSLMLTAGGVVVWRVLDGTGVNALRDAAAASFATAYLPFMGGFVMLMLAQPDGAARVALFVLLSVASDTGGYVVGVRFGRHPLAPSVSPKKSWEGLVGSFLLACTVGAIGMVWAFDGSPAVGLALGAAAVLTATIGDLSESLLKRDLELKDMGSLLPGHGGVLDRVDSMLLSAPLVYLLLLVAVPVPGA